MKKNLVQATGEPASSASAITHTPGPWSFGYLDTNAQRTVMSRHIEICTCWHHSVGAIEHQMEANACLIAAAPILKEAIKPLAFCDPNQPPKGVAIEDWCGAVHAAREALGAATKVHKS